MCLNLDPRYTFKQLFEIEKTTGYPYISMDSANLGCTLENQPISQLSIGTKAAF
jgi:hypothetical protein